MPLLHTSFSVLALGSLMTLLAPCATVSGQIRIDSPSVRSRALSDIVVWLDPQSPPPQPPQPEHVRLLQKDKTFHPHVLVIRTGTIVDFPNADPIFHNAFSTYDGQIFDVGLYPPGTNQSIRFRRAGVVRVFCNIHPSMSAVIVVVNTPYFTTASDKGSYRFANVPEGSYRVNVYDERGALGQHTSLPLEVGSSQPELAAPLITVSEAGYVRVQHKNKYGLDYPPGSETAPYGEAPK